MGGMWKRVAGVFVDFGDQSAASSPSGELSEADLAAELAKIRKDAGLDEETEAPAAEEPAEAPATPPPPQISGDIIAFVDKPLAEIYSQAGVPVAKRSVEMILSFMAGLKALPFDAQTAAVHAMDAADDTWEISDVVSDAKAKVAALTSAKDGLAAADRAADQKATEEQTALDAYLAEARAEIERQIAELQATLQTETDEVNKKKAEIIGRRGAERDAVSRGQIRFDDEIKRLSVIPQHFTTK